MSKTERGLWRMKDGRTIKIAEMTDNHLIYSMKMLEREMAIYYAEQEMSAIVDADIGDVFPKWNELHDEAIHRAVVWYTEAGTRVYACPMTSNIGRCQLVDGHEGEHEYHRTVAL